jgi:hypothetical protein
MAVHDGFPQIVEKLTNTRFQDNLDVIGQIRKSLTAYGVAYLIDGGSLFNYAVSKDTRLVDDHYGDVWVIAEFH